MEKVLLLIYSIIIIISSITSIILYGIDKQKAIKNKIRVKEKVLLFFTVFGGAIGSVIATNAFKHKTDKSYFTITIYCSFVLQLITIFILVFKYLEVLS